MVERLTSSLSRHQQRMHDAVRYFRRAKTVSEQAYHWAAYIDSLKLATRAAQKILEEKDRPRAHYWNNMAKEDPIVNYLLRARDAAHHEHDNGGEPVIETLVEADVPVVGRLRTRSLLLHNVNINGVDASGFATVEGMEVYSTFAANSPVKVKAEFQMRSVCDVNGNRYEPPVHECDDHLEAAYSFLEHATEWLSKLAREARSTGKQKRSA